MVLATREQLPTAVALVELDGVARRLVLCTPDVTPEQLGGVCAAAEADAVLVDDAGAALQPSIFSSNAPAGREICSGDAQSTEWILLTSGTTGMPKLVVHSFESLAGALPRQPTRSDPWSGALSTTFAAMAGCRFICAP